ncbi:hypothetical protein NDU88_004108 [Pleurodeles waltl]|uniref:Uncharacterized protein n=1 Tax=Pleurodeles waltl TaxID=8319 RepID=A0AAV7M8Y2_PLEWA|nr:hypothetical protein NDU88_004108 [Pleurodeles waltl]
MRCFSLPQESDAPISGWGTLDPCRFTLILTPSDDAHEIRQHSDEKLSYKGFALILAAASGCCIISPATMQINSVAEVRKTVIECKKRLHDCKRRTKEKMARNRKAALQTGGGSPAHQEALDQMEEMVAAIIPEEIVTGIQGQQRRLPGDNAHAG